MPGQLALVIESTHESMLMTTSRACALIADDDEFFRIAVAAILTHQLGFETVLEASSLDEALDLLGSRDDIGLALVDLTMPGMEAGPGLPAIREGAPCVTLVVVSDTTSRIDILSALGAGVHGYVQKATGPAELCRALIMVLGGDIYVPASLARPPYSESPIAPAFQQRSSEGNTRLTQRQREILNALGSGNSNKQIARDLGLGAGTVKIHVAAVLRALQLPNRAAAAAYAARQPVQDAV